MWHRNDWTRLSAVKRFFGFRLLRQKTNIRNTSSKDPKKGSNSWALHIWIGGDSMSGVTNAKKKSIHSSKTRQDKINTRSTCAGLALA
jgi:hypothetical protein